MPQTSENYRETIANNGFAIVSSCLNRFEVDSLAKAIRRSFSDAQESPGEAIRSHGEVYAIRNLATVVPAVREFEQHFAVRELIDPILGDDAFLVRASRFTKSSAANWGVFWHQDLSIAVRKRAKVAGYGPWTRKAGVDCVQPPVGILQQMLAIRIHLDDCHVENGPLKVIPGSHRHDRLSDHQTTELCSSQDPVVCTVPAGGVVVMRPLLLHASSKAISPNQRRVIHLEFANVELPVPLEWHDRRTTVAAG